MAARGAAEPGAVVLGSRLFVDEVPWRSTVGNVASRLLLRAVTGLRLVDTQTGLRAYPAGLLPWLAQVPGDRFEYELEVLLRGAPGGATTEANGGLGGSFHAERVAVTPCAWLTINVGLGHGSGGTGLGELVVLPRSSRFSMNL